MGVLMVRPKRGDLAEVANQVDSGDLRVEVERIYPLEDLPAALRHLGEGKALGKLVIEMA
jgi:NADPH:quinone reductase-like Zn-dependent oxidoreductase